MTDHSLDVFDRTIQKTNIWLREIMEEMGWSDKHQAYHALRTVLHTLRDHLTIEEIAQFGAQLPLLIRGVYYENWKPATTPLRERDVDHFYARIAMAYQNDETDLEQLVAAIFRVIAAHVSQGEIEDVIAILPTPLKEIWYQSLT